MKSQNQTVRCLDVEFYLTLIKSILKFNRNFSNIAAEIALVFQSEYETPDYFFHFYNFSMPG